MYTIRQINTQDIPALVRFRIKLFQEMGLLTSLEEEKSLSQACLEYFKTAIMKNEFFAWIAEVNAAIIATSGLVFLQKPPSPNNLSGKEAYIMNLYTLPEWRKRGIGSKLFQYLLDYALENRISLIRLHTTEVGRSIYEKFGFVITTNEMGYHLDQED